MTIGLTAAVLAPAALVAAPAQAATRPGRITAVTSAPGPHAGEVTIRWKQTGGHTTSFLVETGLTTFGAQSATLPDHGRHTTYVRVGGTRRSVTLTAAQVKAAGAAAGTGNHLFFRLTAVNTKGAGTAKRPYPYLQSVAPKPVAPKAGTPLRVASFNVRTARTSDGPSWLSRVAKVAATIDSRDPGVVAVQELNPGRADGRAGVTTGSVRQTDSLVNALRTRGAGRYRLVRTTPYVEPGVVAGSQGTRVLYDSSRYRVSRACPESTNGRSWSSSCSMQLPIAAGDPATQRRSAAWAELQDLASGKRFLVVSVHLDNRKSSNAATQKRYQALRAAQVRAVTARVDAINTQHLPVVLAGDLNSWQAALGGNPPHDALTKAGYYDTADAVTQVNTRWTTYNGFARTVAKSASGWGARLDVISTKGLRGAVRFENVLTRTESNRASDHDMVVADLRLP
ncbi:endonuclease/exonuclease/phosphatase family protein [Angustibacter aerolatus]